MQTLTTKTPKIDSENFLSLAKTGHYPLFYREWMEESLTTKYNLTFRKASHNVQHVFHQLARHRTLEKKKTALIGMDRISRSEFIRSFFKIVEHKLLEDIKNLH